VAFSHRRLRPPARQRRGAGARATLVALRDHGWRLEKGATRLQAPAAHGERMTEDLDPRIHHYYGEGPGTAALRTSLAPLIASDTLVLSAMNGVPWWSATGSPALGTRPRLESVIPARHRRTIAGRQVIGCVGARERRHRRPRHHAAPHGTGLIIGRTRGQFRAGAGASASAHRAAGFEVPVRGASATTSGTSCGAT